MAPNPSSSTLRTRSPNRRTSRVPENARVNASITQPRDERSQDFGFPTRRTYPTVEAYLAHGSQAREQVLPHSVTQYMALPCHGE